MSDADQLHDLGQKLATALTSSYGVSSPGAYLVFLPGGISVPLDIVQSGLVNPTQMQTWLSMNFDCPFIISGAECAAHQKDPSHGFASRIYTIAATTAQPIGNPLDDSWKRVSGEIAAAQRSLGPPDGQKTIVCEPDDWVLSSDTGGYWTIFDSTQTDTASSGTETTTAHRPPQNWMPLTPTPKVNPQFWMVRSLAEEEPIKPAPPPPSPEVDPALHIETLSLISPVTAVNQPVTQIRTYNPGFTKQISMVDARETNMRAERVSTQVLVDNAPTIAATPMLQTWRVAAASGTLSEVSSHALFETAAPIVNVTATTSSTIVVHLEHQCVTLGYFRAGQPWWDGVFLADAGWFIPGMARGGLLPAPDGTNGLDYGLPMALVIVRNLRISGKWSAEASAALSSQGGTLGPLSLFGASTTVESDGSITYSHDGMQVVALLCSTIPILPPVDSPPSA